MITTATRLRMPVLDCRAGSTWMKPGLPGTQSKKKLHNFSKKPKVQIRHNFFYSYCFQPQIFGHSKKKIVKYDKVASLRKPLFLSIALSMLLNTLRQRMKKVKLGEFSLSLLLGGDETMTLN